MPYYIARCQWRDDGNFGALDELPDAWSLLDEEFETLDEARSSAHDDRVAQVQQRGGWMGVHRLGLRRLDYRFIEGRDFEEALMKARRELSPDLVSEERTGG